MADRPPPRETDVRLAVFDIDGTLVTGRGTEPRFGMHLVARRTLSWRQGISFLGFALRYAPLYGRHVFKKDKAWLTGLTPAEVGDVAGQWVHEVVRNHWFSPCLDRLRSHLAEGDHVALLSGTPDFLAEPIARELGAHRWIGSRCAVRGGRFSSAPPLRHPFGATKVGLALELCTELGLEPDRMVAYGDSLHDAPLLRVAGRAVAVRPDAGLRRIAQREGWEILGDRRAPVGVVASSTVR